MVDTTRRVLPKGVGKKGWEFTIWHTKNGRESCHIGFHKGLVDPSSGFSLKYFLLVSIFERCASFCWRYRERVWTPQLVFVFEEPFEWDYIRRHLFLSMFLFHLSFGVIIYYFMLQACKHANGSWCSCVFDTEILHSNSDQWNGACCVSGLSCKYCRTLQYIEPYLKILNIILL